MKRFDYNLYGTLFETLWSKLININHNLKCESNRDRKKILSNLPIKW